MASVGLLNVAVAICEKSQHNGSTGTRSQRKLTWLSTGLVRDTTRRTAVKSVTKVTRAQLSKERRIREPAKVPVLLPFSGQNGSKACKDVNRTASPLLGDPLHFVQVNAEDHGDGNIGQDITE